MNLSHTLSPSMLKQIVPLESAIQSTIEQWRNDLCQILKGKDKRIALIVGPCSIHDLKAAWEMAEKIHSLSEQVKDSFFIIMRTYFEKARSANSWKGYLYDPYLDQTDQFEHGITSARQFLMQTASLGIPCGCEFLDPLACQYFSDLITWGSIGARTVQSPVHRQMASLLPMPVGFKNPTDGNVDVAIQALLCAQSKQRFLSVDEKGILSMVQSGGNLHAHLVLRGGILQPNYDTQSIQSALYKLQKAQMPQYVFIDCSHDNSQKSYSKQIKVFQSAIQQHIEMPQSIRGIMLESYLFAGHQSWPSDSCTPSSLKYGVSITDPCLDWISTQSIIKESYQKLQCNASQQTVNTSFAQEIDSCLTTY